MSNCGPKRPSPAQSFTKPPTKLSSSTLRKAHHRWRSTSDATAHFAGRRRGGAARHHLTHLERVAGGQGGAGASHLHVGRLLVRDRIEGALPVERVLALGQIPGRVLEDRAPRRDLAPERSGGTVSRGRGV